jgi:hypothetical protein
MSGAVQNGNQTASSLARRGRFLLGVVSWDSRRWRGKIKEIKRA